jgi:hypothetical protein
MRIDIKDITEDLSLSSQINPRCPKWRLKVDCFMGTESRRFRRDRIPFDPTKLVGKLREEIILRNGWQDFEMLVKDGDNDIEATIHDCDVLEDVVDDGDVILARIDIQDNEGLFQEQELVSVKASETVQSLPPLSPECLNAIPLLPAGGNEADCLPIPAITFEDGPDASVSNSPSEYTSLAPSRQPSPQPAMRFASPSATLCDCAPKSIIESIWELSINAPVGDTPCDDSSLWLASATRVVSCDDPLSNALESIALALSHNQTSSQPQLAMPILPSPPTPPQGTHSFMVLPRSEHLAALHTILQEESQNCNHKAIVCFPNPVAARLSGVIFRQVGHIGPIFQQRFEPIQGLVPAENSFARFDDAERGVLFRISPNCPSPDVDLIIRLNGLENSDDTFVDSVASNIGARSLVLLDPSDETYLSRARSGCLTETIPISSSQLQESWDAIESGAIRGPHHNLELRIWLDRFRLMK